MADSPDSDRSTDSSGNEEPRVETAVRAVARMLANPRRIRRD
ncbi:hypothetical protein [Blastococcus sp. LR1]|nr:hypothetical protein [Blastococcus sp. LR1]